MQKIVINVHTQPLIPINAVPCPFVKSDVGICLLKYAFCLSSTEEATFSKNSFDKDRHQQGISDLLSLCITPAILNQLRLNVLKLVCEVTRKYQISQEEDAAEKYCHQSFFTERISQQWFRLVRWLYTKSDQY